jgi:hypothetical protein
MLVRSRATRWARCGTRGPQPQTLSPTCTPLRSRRRSCCWCRRGWTPSPTARRPDRLCSHRRPRRRRGPACATPRSRAPESRAPHAHVPSGKCGMVSSGASAQARCDPGDPGCLPGFRFPPRRGGLPADVPGWSSIDGGKEEFPLLPEISRSSRSTRAVSCALAASSSVTRSASAAFARPCTAITVSRAAQPAHPATEPPSGKVTDHHDQDIHTVSKATRWAGSEKINHRPAVTHVNSNGQTAQEDECLRRTCARESGIPAGRGTAKATGGNRTRRR